MYVITIFNDSPPICAQLIESVKVLGLISDYNSINSNIKGCQYREELYYISKELLLYVQEVLTHFV